jgi:DNA-directed RNA polymerase specialized sigma24 family protein
VLLANLGFTAKEISLIVNKNLTAVQKSIQRAKK